MRLTLSINLDNDAMREGAHLAAALRTIANALEPRSHAGLERCLSKVWDGNGNVVGHWRIIGHAAPSSPCPECERSNGPGYNGPCEH